MSEPAGPPQVEFAAITDKGRVRASNQDAVLAMAGATPGVVILAVADGVGGLKGGAETSTLVLEAVAAAAREADEPVAAVRDAVRSVNTSVYEQGAAVGQPSGTTLVLVIIVAEELHVLHAGDSRAYLLRAGHLVPLTRDHSWVADQVRSGAMTNAAAASSPYRNIITRAIGVESTVELEEREPEACRVGDLLLLSSDGLHGLVSDTEIEATLLRHGAMNLDGLAQTLVDLANEHGGTDNVAVVLARILAVPELPATRPRDDVRTAVTRQISLDVP
ncbi:MAG: protein phosphatase 2C domain-containing protein [Dehalococcoidia bacterium]|nr:protein phosphatase 2C domain-containing protein [Dehalococcoidia bacterium]